jgi:eukaryotic-like serine/threonine-protein kinase
LRRAIHFLVPAICDEGKFTARDDHPTNASRHRANIGYSSVRVKDSLAATERVGRYQLLEPIGSGPSGMVSRAKVYGVAGFERQFAVKRFLPELTMGPYAQALSAAARSYGSLEHPRIARMSEFGVAQGQTFTAVELVTGLDAFRLLQEAKLAGVAIAAGGALALVSQAARAVGYAHGRGLSHLGLSPTNVIVTGDGDVKVTDFGILSATLPERPAESPRLVARVPYLAPEQIAGESTSAATDVFVLGVIAYELVTGQRAYRGVTPAQVAEAILAGPPAEPPLPRPLVRVLQRCLARSPFERFPDARALADALDAALRVAPVPGTRKEIGAQVKTALERYAQLNEDNVSGMVALNLPASADMGSRPEARTKPSPMPTAHGPAASPAAAASTHRGIPSSVSTMPGLAPPIPAPGAASSRGGLAKAAAVPGSTSTIPGLAPVKAPPIPSIPSRKPPVAVPAPVARPELLDDEALIEIDDDDTGAMPAADPATILGVAPAAKPPVTPAHSFETATGEMSRARLDALNRRATLPTTELPPPPAPAIAVEPGGSGASNSVASSGAGAVNVAGRAPSDVPAAASSEPASAATSVDPVAAFAADAEMVAATLDEPAGSTMPGHAPARAGSPGGQRAETDPVHPPASSRVPKLIALVLGLGVVGAAGFVAYRELVVKHSAAPEPTLVARGGNDPAIGAQDSSDHPSSANGAGEDGAHGSAGSAKDSGSAVAQGSVDSGSAGDGPDAGSAGATADKPVVATPAATSDSLQVTSKPAGARVFIDGADQGITPLKVEGSSDRHTLAVLLPGHDLYVAEVDGAGVFNVELKPVTPSGGHAGIKVIKCKDKERYYVYVDGNPTGMTCPTERIDTVVGPHTVEVYDIVTETRRKFDIVVKDKRLSVRVKIE